MTIAQTKVHRRKAPAFSGKRDFIVSREIEAEAAPYGLTSNVREEAQAALTVRPLTIGRTSKRQPTNCRLPACSGHGAGARLPPLTPSRSRPSKDGVFNTNHLPDEWIAAW